MSRRREGSPASGPPAIVTAPALGRASPARSRNRVLFPAPFGPTTRWHSPGLTERETPRSARAAPKRRSRPRASRGGGGGRGRGGARRGGAARAGGLGGERNPRRASGAAARSRGGVSRHGPEYI